MYLELSSSLFSLSQFGPLFLMKCWSTITSTSVVEVLDVTHFRSRSVGGDTSVVEVLDVTHFRSRSVGGDTSVVEVLEGTLP